MFHARLTSLLSRLLPVLSLCLVVDMASAEGLSPAQVHKVGMRIWKNECAGTVEGLTSWNRGEDFASLGIGHFIWYPAGAKGPFEESFPSLVVFLKQRGVAMPHWLVKAAACPWGSRRAFVQDSQSERQKELRKLLAATVREQVEYIMARLDRTVPRLEKAGGKAVRQNYGALARTPEGLFAMLDYINFKGDGINSSERYNGEGWGLAQVLADMRGQDTRAFAEAAKRVLARRVKNSPPARNEKQWLAGWSSRCDGYRQPL